MKPRKRSLGDAEPLGQKLKLSDGGPALVAGYPFPDAQPAEPVGRLAVGVEPRAGEPAAASVAAREEERQWIACELHDRVAQTLALVSQQLELLESLIGGDLRARQVATRASSLLREAIRECRNLMDDPPPLVEEFGLVPLMRQELHRLREETGCYTRFDAESPARLAPEVAVVLYRIGREALINVRRHAAGARNVRVALECSKQRVILEVEDDGLGLDGAAAQRRGMGGLVSMRRRAEMIGGSFRVVGVAGRGTRVTVQVPNRTDRPRAAASG